MELSKSDLHIIMTWFQTYDAEMKTRAMDTFLAERIEAELEGDVMGRMSECVRVMGGH